MADLSTSSRGIAFLERHEGVVLKAYRDVVGVLTIGAGLTAASGVVKPVPGMTITREEASRLLQLALRRNYEPAVRGAMPGARQHELDGGVSFHWNTGAIARASWVQAWLRRDWPGVGRGLMLWTKGGGKVLPGLERRRGEENQLIAMGIYAASDLKPKRRPGYAPVTLRLSQAELAAARDGFRTLGYDPGPNAEFIELGAVERFQKDHDLTVDGIVGRATLTTLQRRLDARRKSGQTVAAGAGGAATTQAPGIGETVPDAVILGGVAVVLAASLIWLAWKYRDVVAAKVQRPAPKLAKWLRSK